MESDKVNLLAVDTSTRTGGVAVLKEDTVVAALEVTTAKTHAQRLMSAIDSVLRMAELELESCHAFAVTVGPGSFTGLRIGVSAVKGLAFATGKPVTGVSSLDVLASQFPCFPHVICPMLDARKDQVYTALYQWHPDGRWDQMVKPSAVDPKEWLSQITPPCLFVGDGSAVYRALIKDMVGPLAKFVPSYLNTLRPSVVAHLGLEQIKRGDTCDVALLAPNYIRKSDAEIKLETGQLKVPQGYGKE